MDWGVLQVRRRTKQQHHIVQILGARPPYGAPVQHAWQCTTCGDHEVFSGCGSLQSAWVTAQMHISLWGGTIA